MEDERDSSVISNHAFVACHANIWEERERERDKVRNFFASKGVGA